MVEQKDNSKLAYGVYIGLFVAMMLAVLLLSIWDDIAPASSGKEPEPTAMPTQVVIATPTTTVTAPPVAVSIDAPDSAKERKRFNVIVTIAEVVDLDTAQYEISYDPSVVKVTEVVNGQIDGTAVLIEEWSFVPANELGTIQISNKVGGDSWASGSGYLVEIEFKVIGKSGDSCDIDFGTGELRNKDAEHMPGIWNGDSVAIE